MTTYTDPITGRERTTAAEHNQEESMPYYIATDADGLAIYGIGRSEDAARADAETGESDATYYVYRATERLYRAVAEGGGAPQDVRWSLVGGIAADYCAEHGICDRHTADLDAQEEETIYDIVRSLQKRFEAELSQLTPGMQELEVSRWEDEPWWPLGPRVDPRSLAWRVPGGGLVEFTSTGPDHGFVIAARPSAPTLEATPRARRQA